MLFKKIVKNSLNRECPICEHKKGIALYTQKFVFYNNHVLPEQYDIVSCEACGCIFADTCASQNTYDQYYTATSRYEFSYIESDTRLYCERVNWIEQLVLNKKSRIVDIGCGNGELLRKLRKRGYTNLTGIDPSAQCINNLRSEGFEAIQGSVFDCFKIKNYDCAILSGVLEHIRDVSKLINSIKILIKANGFLLVCVPDSARYYAYDEIPFDYFNIEHINHFDEISLINLGLQHGMPVVFLQKTEICVGSIKQPVIFCAYSNTNFEKSNFLSYSRERINAYIKRTSSSYLKKYSVIDELAFSREEIVVWGAGNFAYRLLAMSALKYCQIYFWVDNDPHKQGTEILSRPVYNPEMLLKYPMMTILVAVAVYSDDIAAQIKSMGLSGRIITLS